MGGASPLTQAKSKLLEPGLDKVVWQLGQGVKASWTLESGIGETVSCSNKGLTRRRRQGGARNFEPALPLEAVLTKE